MIRTDKSILAFATQGAGGNDEVRLRTLLQHVPVSYFPFDRRKKRTAFQLLRTALRDCDLAIMEGTGVAGGLALLSSGKPYIFSSGDAIAPFVRSKQPLLAGGFFQYEKSLYARCRGFIGWTPYLCGRALSFGAPRALTAAGWAPQAAKGRSLRRELNIPESALVIGIAGSLDWNARFQYCYGAELHRAMQRIQRKDVYGLVVGSGTGLPRLSGPNMVLPGGVPRERIPDFLATMDLASLPQSCDQLGSFRYSTKLPEYLAAGLPVVTGQLPLAYDLDSGWLWRLPGSAPWADVYVAALAALIDRLTPEELAKRRQAVPSRLPEFDADLQANRVTALIEDVLADL